jgi:hypothetical protein
MPNPYVRIHRWGFSGNCDMLVYSNGTDEWCKNLTEFTSYVSVMKTPEEVIKFKQSFCEQISEDTGKLFTIEDLDRIVTKKDYQMGAWALAEYKHIVDTNIKCIEEGKEPFYLAPSIAGDNLVKALLKRELKDA